MKFIKLLLSLALLALLALTAQKVSAQTEETLALRLSRDFGYSSGSGKIQGTFSLRASGPADLQKVSFLIDGQPIGEASQAPFRWQFQTGSYALGIHVLLAVGTTASGRELRSNTLRVEFVSAEEGWQAGARLALPIFGLVFGVLILSFVAMSIGTRKLQSLPPGTQRAYGAGGGTICTRCGRPFPLSLLTPHILTGKVARCPFCGKWGLHHTRPLAELRAAEEAEVTDAMKDQLPLTAGGEEGLRKEIEDTRFQDL